MENQNKYIDELIRRFKIEVEKKIEVAFMA